MFFAIVAIIACGFVSYINFNEFFNSELESTKRKNMNLFVAIAFGFLSLINLVKLIGGMREKKAE